MAQKPTSISTKAKKVEDLLSEVNKEVQDDELKEAKAELKTRVVQLQKAKQIVANIERELELLKIKITDKLV